MNRRLSFGLVVTLGMLTVITLWSQPQRPPRPKIEIVPLTNAPLINASNRTPDQVATALMSVPIYNFAVHNLSFSPDGQTLATGDGTGIIRLWDTASGKLKVTIPAHSNWAFSVVWSKSGKFFVTGGGDDRVHIFNERNTGKPRATLAAHKGDVHAVVITPDDRWIASAGDDREIIVWNTAQGDIRQRWIGHDKQIPTLALSPDGKRLASGSRDDSIKLWNLENGELQDTLIGHSDDVLSVKFSPDGHWLASASYDRTVRLWNAQSGKATKVLHGHTNRVFNVAFSPNGECLASAGDATVRIWDTKLGTDVRTISFGGMIATPAGKVPEMLSAVAYSPNGKLIAVASTTGLTFLIDAESGTVSRRLESK